MACGSMAQADALALLKLLPQAGIDIDPQRDLARFTDFAVQIRYDHQPDPQNLECSRWNNRTEAMATTIETLIPPPPRHGHNSPRHHPSRREARDKLLSE